MARMPLVRRDSAGEIRRTEVISRTFFQSPPSIETSSSSETAPFCTMLIMFS
jgi:hypothetical protein